MRFREVKGPVQVQPASKRHRWNLNRGILSPQSDHLGVLIA